MVVKYCISNCLHITGLPLELKSYYKEYCQFQTDSYASKDIPPDLNLFLEHADGSISIPRGLEAHLVSMLQVRGIAVEVTLDVAESIDHNFTIEPTINYTTGLFGYQGRCVDDLLQHRTGRLELPAGSGKTTLACLATAVSKDGPMLFLVHTDKLLRQFVNTVPKVLGIPVEEVGIIKGPKANIKPITVGSLRTLGGQKFDIGKYKHTFATVFFDECHLSSALTYRKVLLELAPKRLYGLSATPEHYSSEDLSRLMESLLGKVVVKLTPDQLPKRITPEIFTRNTGRSFKFMEIAGKPEFMVYKARHKLMDDLTNDASRNKMIVEDCVRLVQMGYKLLIAVTRVEHGKILSSMLAERGVNISFPYREVNKTVTKRGKKVKTKALSVHHKQLDIDVNSIATGESDGIAGTFALFGTGFDSPALSAVIIAGPYSGRNSTLTIQVTGRVQRHYYGKNSAVVMDYSDDSYPNNVLRKWSDDRAEVFLAEFGNRDVIT